MHLAKTIVAFCLPVAFAAAAFAYPPAGQDSVSVSAQAFVFIYSPPQTASAMLNGSTVISRGNPVDPGDSRIQVPTEIVSMSLTGMSALGPMALGNMSHPPSAGLIKQQVGGVDFPAESFFDIYYRIELPSIMFQGETQMPAHHESSILSIPPYNSIYIANPAVPIQLFDPFSPSGPPIGELLVQYIRIEPPVPPIEIELVQLDLRGAGLPIIPNSTIGRVQVSMNPPPESLTYINIIADSVGSGVPKWIVRNLPIIPFYLDPVPHCFKTIFDLAVCGVIPGVPISTLNIQTTISSIPLLSMPLPVTWTTVGVGEALYSAEGRPGGPYDFSGSPGTMSLLDFTIPHPIRLEWRTGVPNVEAGANECGPAAAANSFAWLAAREGYPGMPSLEEILDSLKNSRHMNTDPVDGTNDDDMIKGKLRLIDELDLPWEVHFQDNDFGDSNITTPHGTANGQGRRPTWEWIEEQVDAGQDVEIGITWLDSAGNPNGGHWVTLEGKIDFGGGARGFWYRHDTQQDSAGGTDSSHFSWVTMRPDSFLVLENEPANYIDIVVAESPISQGFIPGDANGDGFLLASDVTYLVRYLKGINPPPNPLLAGDANGDCVVIGSDVTYMVRYFKGLGAPPHAGNCR